MPQTFSVGSRSLLVTTLSWLLILVGGLSLVSPLVSLLVMGLGKVGLYASPLIVQEALAYWPVVLAVLLTVGAVALVSGVGLLQRLDWGRRLSIAVLLAAIPVLMGLMWLQYEGIQTTVQQALAQLSLPVPVRSMFEDFSWSTRLLLGALGLWTCGILAWVALRLTTSGVRQEFA